jgi:hypothetical protein
MTDFTFLELFPSSLLSYCWPDSQELNEQLSKIILEKEQEDLGIQASNVGGWHSKRDLHCASPQSKTHQEQCILKSSLTSGPNLSVVFEWPDAQDFFVTG